MTKMSRETLQNLPYFWNKKIQVVFLFCISSNSGFVTVNGALVYVITNPKKLELKDIEKHIWVFLLQKYGKF